MPQQRDESGPRRLRRTAFAALAAAGTAAVIGTSAFASAHQTVVFLASNNAPDVTQEVCLAEQGCGAHVTAPVTLRSGQSYDIRVSGTVSAWSFWREYCGKPEPRAEFPTPGLATPTGDDAQFRFAIHGPRRGRQCRSTPFTMPLFQINLGSGWFHPIAVGNPSKPSGNHGRVQHPYTFLVVGQGAQPQFRYDDFRPSDDNGKFKIVVGETP
jgi:hypothetical protein